MRIDGRTRSHETSETIRRLAVQRVKDGEAPSRVIKSYGLCRTTIYKWLRAERRGGAVRMTPSLSFLLLAALQDLGGRRLLAPRARRGRRRDER